MSELPTTVRASNIGAMLGCDSRKSPLALFHEMRGNLPQPEDNELLEEGREFEDAIARIAGRKAGLEIARLATIQLIDGPISGHPDRIYLDNAKNQMGIVECKNALRSREDWGDAGSDFVPKHYWLQTQAYNGMLQHFDSKLFGKLLHRDGLTVSPDAILAANLFAGTKLFTIRLDIEVYGKIKEEAERFLHRVHENDPPDPRDEADMRMRWLAQDGKRVEVTPDCEGWLASIADLRANIKVAQKGLSDLQALVFGFAQDASSIVKDGKVIATLGAHRAFNEAKFIASAPSSVSAACMKFDKAAAKKALPSLYDECMEAPTNPIEQTRVLRLKGEK